MKADIFRNLKLQEKRLQEGLRQFSHEKERILEALEIARQAHKGQKRDEGDAYIIHPIRVANTLIYDLKTTDSNMVIVGLLHDVVEDADVSVGQLRERFGERVAELVSGLTRDKNKETKQEKFEKTIAGPEDIRLLKACDWLDNLRSFPFRTDRGERWQRHLKEAKEMYLPLAKATNNEWLVKKMQKAYDVLPIDKKLGVNG